MAPECDETVVGPDVEVGEVFGLVEEEPGGGFADDGHHGEAEIDRQTRGRPGKEVGVVGDQGDVHGDQGQGTPERHVTPQDVFADGVEVGRRLGKEVQLGGSPAFLTMLR